jgi:hypothetical protein
MKFDERIQSRVKALTDKVGTPIKIIRRTLTDAPNPTQSSKREYSTVARILYYRASEVDGALIQQDDFMLQVPAEGLAITPSVKDAVSVNGGEHQIIDVQPSYISTTVAFYRLQVR